MVMEATGINLKRNKIKKKQLKKNLQEHVPILFLLDHLNLFYFRIRYLV